MANDSTPVQAGAGNVPLGHVIGHEKWKGSQIAQEMQGKVKLILEDGLGLVDFHLSNRCCILYLSEADLVAGNAFKRRLVRFRNACNLQGIVLVEKTQISNQYFPDVQKFVVLELGMTLLPVASQKEAAQLIAQLPFLAEKWKPKVILVVENENRNKNEVATNAKNCKIWGRGLCFIQGESEED
ncbi:PREDICTED: Fanconi anemia-associated protein of 24 kDa [Thamnophis sirtalis]|uniref:Fanconi anemia-associated protein of 24 kDa n=1 Tax=Thamnophis sirtalis TaxID=35019 RepID=A0A6I9YJM3_9SAUR|nr:PREDICTED: Fanconi anemia-associated protein of 24 kDa [Thamnophis sirtalis]